MSVKLEGWTSIARLLGTVLQSVVRCVRILDGISSKAGLTRITEAGISVKISLLAGFFAAVAALQATGTDVYVAADGVDDNAPGRGTESSPYASTPYSLAQLGAASDGTVLMVR